MKSSRSILVLCGWFVCASVSIGTAAEPSFEKTIAPFLQKYCHDCHGADLQESGIRLDRPTAYDTSDRHLWTMVHEVLSHNEMPPKDQTQPTAAEIQAVTSWIKISQQKHPAAGTRRLNRRELGAALRDVTGLSVSYENALPGDGKVDGFDTGADALTDAAASVSQLMEVTRRAAAGLRFLEPAGEPYIANLRTQEKDPGKAFDAWKNRNANVKSRGISQVGEGLLIEPKWLGERGGFQFYLPIPEDGNGVIRIKLVVSVKTFFPEIPNPHFWLELGGRDIDTREITGTLDQPDVLIYEVQMDDLPKDSKGRGLSIELQNKVEMPYEVKGYENDTKLKPGEKIPGGAGVFRPKYDRKKTPLEERPVPFLVLQEIEIETDFRKTWPPESWDVDLPALEDSAETARTLLTLWMERAWRRPIEPGEADRFFALYEKLRGQKYSFDEALRSAFQSVLMSGSFRYLTSPEDTAEKHRGFAFASRLSFFLTGAPPDAKLRELAHAGQLSDPKVLDAQVDRLLGSPKSAGFIRPFVTQWLQMDQPITLTMSAFQKQDFRFGRHLKDSMKAETIEYFAEILRENRPARELLHSDWTMMNDVLAWHYEYPPLEGAKLRKVALRNDDPRGGGITSHAGIQSMLCWMGDNWVIYRGAWMLRQLLDDPPPPPPLEVPELNASDQENRGKSFRELLAQHQADPNCAVCHTKMDPLGFAFQNFDLSGRWREVEHERYKRNELDGKIEWRGEGKTRPVDATGQLPEGERFENYADFKSKLVENYPDNVTLGLLKKFTLYATGRKPDVADLRELRTILKSHERNGYLLKDVLKAFVRSSVFRK